MIRYFLNIVESRVKDQIFGFFPPINSLSLFHVLVTHQALKLPFTVLLVVLNLFAFVKN